MRKTTNVLQHPSEHKQVFRRSPTAAYEVIISCSISFKCKCKSFKQFELGMKENQ